MVTKQHTAAADYTIAGLTAPQLCTYLLENELEDLYCQIPNGFIQQAMAGFEYFEIDSELIELDLVRIPLQDLKVQGDKVALKFKIQAVLDIKSGKLVQMTKDLAKYEQYLKGFNSLQVCASADLFSKSDWNLLNAYAKWWGEQSNGDLFSRYRNNRLYLKPRNSSFKFQFKLDVRKNPNTGEHVLGLGSDVTLRGATFLDTFSGLLVNEAVGVIEPSKGQRTGRLKLQASQGIRLPNR